MSSGCGVPRAETRIVNLEMLGAVRIEAGTPSNYRLAMYPDGRLVLQGEFIWTEGLRVGSNWRDIPLVMVDTSGEPIGMQHE